MSHYIPTEAINVSELKFVPEILEFPGPVAAEFWSPRCGHCRSFEPVFAEAVRHHAGRIKFVRVNIDESQVAASRFDIRGTPTIVLFDNGREIDRLVGAVPGAELEMHRQKLLR
jgi:thioredoxin-like negative regulator of GroEL